MIRIHARTRRRNVAILALTTIFGALLPWCAGRADFLGPAEPSAGASQHSRLREGTKLTGEIGTFRISGDRATFYVGDGERRFVGLENLNLARVVAAIRDDPGSQWSVSGMVTEYRGANYLLITKAIKKSRPSSGAGAATLRDAGDLEAQAP